MIKYTAVMTAINISQTSMWEVRQTPWIEKVYKSMTKPHIRDHLITRIKEDSQRKQCSIQNREPLSNHDGNAKENVTLKMTSKYFKLVGDSFNSFNLYNVAEQSGSWLCKDSVTVQVEKRKFTVVCSRST